VLRLTANGIKKTLKDEFIDVTLNELAAAYKYVSGLDADLKSYLISGGNAEINSSKVFEYKLKWISLFSNFTIEELRLIPLEGAVDSLSVEWLYNYCKKFLKQPERYLELKEFEHKGIDYHLIKPLKTISGAEMLFGTANFRQFALSSQLASMVENNKNEGGIRSLTQLFALLYSDGNDSSEDVMNRCTDFGEVNALYGWSAYFFFAQLAGKYNDYFHLSMTKNPPPLISKQYLKQQLRALLLKTTFGTLSLTKLPEREFSILKT
jgi:hypothetical protein